ncbi:MAG: DUF934 domain-containing protein [Burkholderiales bacterium]|nr:DUF934 domain-containing protein [Burkholderiales bacterium]
MHAGQPLQASRVLTRDGVFTDDPWPLVASEADVPETDAVLLPLAAYLSQPQSAAHGVWLAPTDDPALLAPHLGSVPLVAVQFPKFADGRGYSLAHLIRRLGYAGDLRAIGEVLIDQLFTLKRVGFSSFALRADQNEDDARAALTRYSNAYQGAHDTPLPAYRRGRRVQVVS